MDVIGKNANGSGTVVPKIINNEGIVYLLLKIPGLSIYCNDYQNLRSNVAFKCINKILSNKIVEFKDDKNNIVRTINTDRYRYIEPMNSEIISKELSRGKLINLLELIKEQSILFLELSIKTYLESIENVEDEYGKTRDERAKNILQKIVKEIPDTKNRIKQLPKVDRNDKNVLELLINYKPYFKRKTVEVAEDNLEINDETSTQKKMKTSSSSSVISKDSSRNQRPIIVKKELGVLLLNRPLQVYLPRDPRFSNLFGYLVVFCIFSADGSSKIFNADLYVIKIFSKEQLKNISFPDSGVTIKGEPPKIFIKSNGEGLGQLLSFNLSNLMKNKIYDNNTFTVFEISSSEELEQVSSGKTFNGSHKLPSRSYDYCGESDVESDDEIESDRLFSDISDADTNPGVIQKSSDETTTGRVGLTTTKGFEIDPKALLEDNSVSEGPGSPKNLLKNT